MFSVKIGLFRISGELQFRVCNHGEPCASSHMAREGEHFYKEEKEVGRAVANRVHGFLFAESLPGEKRSFSSFCWALLSSQGTRAPPYSPLTLRFLFINFLQGL